MSTLQSAGGGTLLILLTPPTLGVGRKPCSSIQFVQRTFAGLWQVGMKGTLVLLVITELSLAEVVTGAPGGRERLTGGWYDRWEEVGD